MIIAIIGGTGKEGKGLAYRWAKAGHQVIIGSRELEKAQRIVLEMNATFTDIQPILGEQNIEAARKATLVVITVPYTAHVPTLESIRDVAQNKIVIDVTVPIVPPKVTHVQIPPSGCAAQEAQEILGENVKVVSAFQNVSYEKLLKDEDLQCDVLVCGNDKEAKLTVLDLIKDIHLKGFDAGPLQNSIVSEGLTSVLININKKFGVQSAGIKITGIE